MAKKVSQTAVKDKKVVSKKATKKEESSDSESSSSDSESDSSSEESDSSSSGSDSESSSSSSDSNSDSPSSDDSDDEEEEEEEKKVTQKDEEEKEAEIEKEEKKEESSNSSSDSDSSSSNSASNSSSSDSSSSDSDSSSSDSDSDSDSDDKKEEEEREEESKKHKINDNEDEDESEKPETKKSKVDASEPATLFVGRLSFNVDDEWLKSEFEPIGGVSAARVISDRQTNRSKGYGYVDFESKESAQKALDTMQGKEIDGRPINLDFSNSKPQALSNKNSERSKKFGDVKSEPSDTLFVGNLSFTTTRESLQEAFAEYGEVISARVPTNPETEQPKGFGYVQFSSIEDATKALNTLNGEYLDGRAVRLDFSTPRPARDNASGGRFGGNRGNGGRGNFGGNRGNFGGNRGNFGGNRGGRSRESTPRNEFKGTKKTFD